MVYLRINSLILPSEGERFLNETSIIVAGFGGQGVLFLGRLIAYAGMLENKESTCFPSYGAEMRGGTANCTTIISDGMIGSPIVKYPDILIAMNEASLKRFQPAVKKEGIVIFDSSFVKTSDLRPDICIVKIPAGEIAALIPDLRIKPANMVMLGALVAAEGLIREDTAMMALERLTSSKRLESLEANKNAIRRGVSYIEGKKSSNSRH